MNKNLAMSMLVVTLIILWVPPFSQMTDNIILWFLNKIFEAEAAIIQQKVQDFGCPVRCAKGELNLEGSNVHSYNNNQTCLMS